MVRKDIPEEIEKILKSISNKRAKIVIEHILKEGSITTEELEKKYGYNHPPRAARDVREAGIPLETHRVKSSDGRSIAAYKFGDLAKIKKDRLHGRKIFSLKFKQRLYEIYSGKCSICYGSFPSRYLQIDHKIPYEVVGDERDVELSFNDYMLLCASCNRAKSWSCEHCPNWQAQKSLKICSNCYWANPENHVHVSLKEIRRADIIWEGEEIRIFEKLKRLAQKNDYKVPDYVKKVVAKFLKN